MVFLLTGPETHRVPFISEFPSPAKSFPRVASPSCTAHTVIPSEARCSSPSRAFCAMNPSFVPPLKRHPERHEGSAFSSLILLCVLPVSAFRFSFLRAAKPTSALFRPTLPSLGRQHVDLRPPAWLHHHCGQRWRQANPSCLTLLNNQGTQKYEIEQTLQPGQQMWIDVGMLIREGIPDKNGKTLPRKRAHRATELFGHLVKSTLRCCH